ncbi:TlpA family protein disulfide reductase [Flavobacterium sedimenticola]|uniref:TlpA disulfide reductase family protein n=1 Tax=Flavobacterium sedimenticola TaxID=3043286 RepID=A0ABT6XSY8_9FLAO|nr:TlpA disulfide reductase family protein [Flavobacterium sedimenticola]MDI9258224.1 TlpA disulfide reductase family protein [Flavobacterium sedimenticola]
MKKVLFIIIAVVAVFAFTNKQKTEFSKESLSQKLITSDSTQITFKEILAQHKGKTTVIEVWASWCSDCVKAMPKVKDMQANHPKVDYVFISMDKAFDKWKNGIAKHELKGAHYWATDGMKGAFGKSIDLDWIPRYIILDKKGKIITYRAIETDFDQINATLKTLE